LENLIRSYILIGSEEALASELVPGAVSDIAPEIDLANPISLKRITREATHNLEQMIILKVLRANGWSRQKTAKWLNISYRSLLYKLEGSPVFARAAASGSTDAEMNRSLSDGQAALAEPAAATTDSIDPRELD
jgi:DNA-binding NtrC family response regulator